MVNFKWYSFSALSGEQVYALLALRADVFVVEQAISYLDPDGRDEQALHLLGYDGDKLAAYARLFLPDQEARIVFGRVVVDKACRKFGYGKMLVKEILDYAQKNYPGITVKCSAQYYLKHFYEGFGLQAYGDVYMEDKIEHIAMATIL
jgi:ElaA protein